MGPRYSPPDYRSRIETTSCSFESKLQVMGSLPDTFAAVDVKIYPCKREAYLSCTPYNADTHLVFISKLLRALLASMPLDRTSPSTALPKCVTTIGP